MRIVQVVQGFPPENLGGTETYAAQLSYILRERGHDVQVFTRANTSDRAEYTVDSIVRDGLLIMRINNTFLYCNIQRTKQWVSNPIQHLQ